MVSVRMVTYNQEKYIAAAIESVLMQKVDFVYELLIGEDASTDGTPAIVDLYQKKYPNIIKVFHRKKNLGRKTNCRLTMQACRGKYVAVLEGDDYWSYDLKLQKQVDYLERHNDIIATAHNVYCIDKNGQPLEEKYIDYPMRKRYVYNRHHAMSLEEIGHSASFVYKNIKYILNKEQWKAFLCCELNGYFKLSITLGMLGQVAFFEDVWCCRRRVFEGDGWSAETYQKNLCYSLFNAYLEAGRYIKAVFSVDINTPYFLYCMFLHTNELALKFPTKENIVVAQKVNIAYAKFLFNRIIDKGRYHLKK